jgi:hypothetical protein
MKNNTVSRAARRVVTPGSTYQPTKTPASQTWKHKRPEAPSKSDRAVSVRRSPHSNSYGYLIHAVFMRQDPKRTRPS